MILLFKNWLPWIGWIKQLINTDVQGVDPVLYSIHFYVYGNSHALAKAFQKGKTIRSLYSNSSPKSKCCRTTADITRGHYTVWIAYSSCKYYSPKIESSSTCYITTGEYPSHALFLQRKNKMLCMLLVENIFYYAYINLWGPVG